LLLIETAGVGRALAGTNRTNSPSDNVMTV
jgi:hypothetical protein